ncbi:uncharacterized protein LOC143317397 [Chaetodon auriga]|uniref:uncharacterized protein LOC143317397 n=1 Tax=Chaetodon auriga TaxID=39042 RepID=UPI004033046C
MTVMARSDQLLFVDFFCFLLFSALSAAEDQQEVKAKPEQDVALQCWAPRGSSITLVEWNRADLKSDGYVFFYRNQRSYENFQHPSFHGRVKLRDPEMKDGDASVVLKKVTVNDTGTYDCRIIVVDAGRAEATPPDIKHLIHLTVTDPDGNVWSGVNVAAAAVGSLVVVVLVVVVVAVAVCSKCKRLEQKPCRAPSEGAGGWMTVEDWTQHSSITSLHPSTSSTLLTRRATLSGLYTLLYQMTSLTRVAKIQAAHATHSSRQPAKSQIQNTPAPPAALPRCWLPGSLIAHEGIVVVVVTAWDVSVPTDVPGFVGVVVVMSVEFSQTWTGDEGAIREGLSLRMAAASSSPPRTGPARLGSAWLGSLGLSAGMMLRAVLSCFLLSPLVSALTDQQEVKAKPEQDVALQCWAPRGSSITLVEWNRADLKSDGYVFFYRNQRSYENFQHPSFHGRVKLRDPEMKDGDASVVLKKVTVNDTGTYDCRIIVVDAGRAEATPPDIKHLIHLTVTDPDGNVWSGVNVAAAAVGSLALLVVVVVVVVVAVAVCRKCKCLEQRPCRALCAGAGGWMA